MVVMTVELRYHQRLMVVVTVLVVILGQGAYGLLMNPRLNMWGRSYRYRLESVIGTGDEGSHSPESVMEAVVAKPDGLKMVKNIIAVSSCKGGVGKSTVSVNLAYTLHQAGAKVGVLDADIYGPSLPTMTGTVGNEVVFHEGKLIPMQYDGVKLMSMGYLSKGPAIIRGPMVNQILNQLITLTDWQELDYLVVDMPPGTGDIQLTLAQMLDISAAVIVTTPQRLSFVDVVKGIDMFDTVNIPTVAVVENMAEVTTYDFPDEFYEHLGDRIVTKYLAASAASKLSLSSRGDGDGARDVSSIEPATISDLIRESVEAQQKPMRIFGAGHSQRLRDMWGIENFVSLPLLASVSTSGDIGRPHVLNDPESPLTDKMVNLAEAVIGEIIKAEDTPKAVEYDPEQNVVKFEGSELPADIIRKSCKCALCVEEMSGRPLLDPATIPIDLKAIGMAPIGRYAISFDWSDGHKSLIPFRQLKDLC